jgi:hypothetical protein
MGRGRGGYNTPFGRARIRAMKEQRIVTVRLPFLGGVEFLARAVVDAGVLLVEQGAEVACASTRWACEPAGPTLAYHVLIVTALAPK